MKKLLMLACTALLLASCSNDDSQSSSSNKEIRFSSELSQLKSTYQGTQIANGQKVGVFIAEDAATPTVTYAQNLTYTGDGQGNLSGATLYFPDNGNSVKISAYHPYNEGSEDAYLFSVASDQTDASSIYASDLLYCPAFVQAPTNGKIVLTFKHLLSQVNVSLTAGNGNPDLTDALISMVNAATAIEFNRKDGSLGSASSIQNVTLGGNVGITVPQTVNAGTKLIKIALKSGKELFYTPGQDLALESGKKYTFNLLVNLTDVASIGTDVDDWETGETINGGASEDLVDKLLPAEITESYFGGRNVQKIVFEYDVLNRVTSATRYIDKDILISPRAYITEYEFRYNGDNTEIIGCTSKDYRSTDLSLSNFYYYNYLNFEFTYDGQGNVSIIYENTESQNGVELVVGANDENTITQTGTETMNFDENGNPVPLPHMMVGSEESSIRDIVITYDDKKNPFINSNMPGWLRAFLFSDSYTASWVSIGSDYTSLRILTYLGAHNVEKIVWPSQSERNYTLTYNNKDYVTKKTVGSDIIWPAPVYTGYYNEVTIKYTDWK